VFDSSNASQPQGPVPVSKSIVAGILMGVANLIPGVSGGTMILVMGIYQEFIESVADITAFRFSRRRIVFLGVVGVSAAVSIKGLAGVILYLLFHHSALMYALFVGMTLGGAPLLARSVGGLNARSVMATLTGLGLMVWIATLKPGGEGTQSALVDGLVGVVAATTMVLPGISGSYILLVLGQYERVVGAVRDLDFGVLIPVAVGAVFGVVALSHALKYLLSRFQRETVGFLLGILLGSVIGLWPFGRAPSEKTLAEQSMVNLRSYADRVGIAIPDMSSDGSSPDGTSSEDVSSEERLAVYLCDHWDARSVDDYAPGTVLLAGMGFFGGFVATFMLSRRRGSTESGDASDSELVGG
jgi:putative membrane protein